MKGARHVDVSCYGCGTVLELETTSPGREAPCRYCGSVLRFLTYSQDRKALKDLRQQFWEPGPRDEPVADLVGVDEGDLVGEPGDAIEGDVSLPGDAGEGDVSRPGDPIDDNVSRPGDPVDDDVSPEVWEPRLTPAEIVEENRSRATSVVDGIPLRFAVRFYHGRFLSEAVEEAPPPPGIEEYDERSGRVDERVGQRYAERLKQELDAVAPKTVEVLTHRRRPSEVGGPGIETDVIDLILKGATVLAAYPAAKVLVTDVRRLMEHVRARTDKPVEIEDCGVAWVFARDALDGFLRRSDDDVIDMRLVACTPLVKSVDFAETYGFMVQFLVAGTMYIVTVDIGGNTRSITSTEPPGIDPPEGAGTI